MLLATLLFTHFNRADTGVGYTKLHQFGVSNGTLVKDFSQECRVEVSAAAKT